MLPFLDDYLRSKNLRDRSIPSRDIESQRILQPDSMRGLTGRSQPKMVVSDAAFPL